MIDKLLKKVFKDYKSKRELREEIVKLNTMLLCNSQVPVIQIERDIAIIRRAVTLDALNSPPIEYIKKECARRMVEEVESLIEWDIEDDPCQSYTGNRILIGRLFISTKR